MTKHLNSHPEIDLDSMLNYVTMDAYTEYRYALGGFIMRKAFEKGGVPLQKKFLVTG